MDEGFVRTNLNNYIKVKLSAEGEKIFEEHYNWLFKGIRNANELKERAAEQMHIDSEGFATFQIHEFMNIFGEFMILGRPPVCEKNMIWFQIQPETKEERVQKGLKEALKLLEYGRIYKDSYGKSCEDVLNELQELLRS